MLEQQYGADSMNLKVITTIGIEASRLHIYKTAKSNTLPSQPSVAHRQDFTAGFHVCFGSPKTELPSLAWGLTANRPAAARGETKVPPPRGQGQ